eukprot:scaffold31485_cov112-Isochrysis_galbana.AAC.4
MTDAIVAATQMHRVQPRSGSNAAARRPAQKSTRSRPAWRKMGLAALTSRSSHRPRSSAFSSGVSVPSGKAPDATADQSAMAAATEILNDWVKPHMGRKKDASEASMKALLTPRRSLPNTSAVPGAAAHSRVSMLCASNRRAVGGEDLQAEGAQVLITVHRFAVPAHRQPARRAHRHASEGALAGSESVCGRQVKLTHRLDDVHLQDAGSAGAAEG